MPNFFPVTTCKVWLQSLTRHDSVYLSKQECAVHSLQAFVRAAVIASPMSRARRVSEEMERRGSSLQDRVTAPTSSELVARIRALSSDKLTPAMEVTSLISSSSLDEMKDDEPHHNCIKENETPLLELGSRINSTTVWDQKCALRRAFNLAAVCCKTPQLQKCKYYCILNHHPAYLPSLTKWPRLQCYQYSLYTVA